MNTTVLGHLDADDRIAINVVESDGNIWLDVGDDTQFCIPRAQIPQRIAEFEAVVRDLRELVDGIIAEPHEPEPDDERRTPDDCTNHGASASHVHTAACYGDGVP